MREVATNVWRLNGFPTGAINTYYADGVLFDAGAKGSTRSILRQLKSKRLDLLALTHAHPDHQGAAKAVCDRYGVPLACHAGDVDAMEGRSPLQPCKPNHPLNRVLHTLLAGPPRSVDRVLQEGDQVGSFRVVHTPGHSPGQVIFFRDSDRVAIIGDVMNTMNLITMWPQLALPPDIFTLDMEMARRSARKLAELEPSVILPGHGRPVRDLAKLKSFADRINA